MSASCRAKLSPYDRPRLPKSDSDSNAFPHSADREDKSETATANDFVGNPSPALIQFVFAINLGPNLDEL